MYTIYVNVNRIWKEVAPTVCYFILRVSDENAIRIIEYKLTVTETICILYLNSLIYDS